jgi:GNAT superfamily N-acetyltransferase
VTTHIELLQQRNMGSALAVFRCLDYDPVVDARWFGRFTVGDPTCPPEMRLVARRGAEIVGFVIGCVRGLELVIKFIAVRPDHRRHGVATALLGALEQTGRSLGLPRAVAGGVGPNFFYPGVDLALTPALSFFWRHGYQTDRVAAVDMLVDLPRAPLDVALDLARLQSEGLCVQRVPRDSLAAVAEFGGRQSDAWRQEVLLAGENEPISAFAAYDGDDPIAFAVYGVTGPHRFGPTLTHPGYRRHGIGGALLKLCLADIHAWGWSQAEITWAGPVQYYARAVGATIHKAYWTFTKNL